MNYIQLQITFLLSALLWMGIARAQNNDLRSYTMEDGLPQSQVYDMVQDEIGYLWLGTRGGGLSRFDGDSFTTFNDRDGLGSNYINTIIFANDSLFIGTQQGVSLKVNDEFVNFKMPQVVTIFRHEKVTFLGTVNGLYKLQKNKTPEKIILHKTLDNNTITNIVFDGQKFWIASNKGLWKLNSLSNNAVVEQYETTNFTSLVLHQENLFAATFMDGIIVLDIFNNEPDRIIVGPQRVNHIGILKNQLWVSTDASGVFVYHSNALSLVKKLNQRNGLSVSHIRKTMTDRNGNIWIATSGGGLYKYFLNEFTHYDKDTGLPGNRIYATHFDGSKLWISNAEAGLATIDSLGIHRIPTIEGFSEVKIKTITSDSHGDIWAGSDGKGILYRETREEHRLLFDGADLDNIQIDTVIQVKNHLINESIGFPSNWIRQLYTRNDTIWAATYSSGIVKLQYNIEKKQLTILKTFEAEDGIEDLLIRDMKADTHGRIWYATQSGHLGYLKNNEITHLGEVLQHKVPINTLLFRNNHLYLGTAGSGVWYASEGNFTQFKKLSGTKRLTSNNCYQLIFDSEENLWMGTEKGVDKILLNKENEIVDVIHFGRNDGFLGIETCLNAVSKDNHGNLWFGAIYGLTKYDSAKTPEETNLNPTIYFENISVGYQSLDSLSAFIGLANNKTLQLQPDQNQISFSYRSVDLDHPKEIEYRFKLNESDWSPWSKSNLQSLAGLGFGAHHFKVQSRNYRWETSDTIDFRFFIESPLHKKTWFQWLIMGVGLCLILLIAWRYIHHVKQKNKAIQKQLEVQNHLLSLEQKALRLQMNPHFIFNVLNGIKAMGTSNPEKMNNTINSFATMLREILYNSRKESISLAQEIKTLKNYIDVELLMASKSFTYDIIITSEMDPEEILIPPMLIQPFVENSIRHGILKSTNAGVLNIEFRTTEDLLYCTISDNGPGIFESQKAKTATDHQSMALSVTEERIESISGKGALQIEEIKENETILGTKVTFKIPLETDY
ncbi:MAG: histidine kinase [Flavobacteriaceae bacterium]|nr:histidine kinase [Flavobacteriaceae bacterium]